MLGRLLVAFLCACMLAGCGGNEEAAADELTGVVVAVDSRGLGDVRSFTVRSDGREREILIDPAIEYEGFPLPHLNEHLATGEPVRVEVERRDGRLYVRSIRDA